MEHHQNTEEFYKRLKDELDKSMIFPAQYLYKFVLPAQEDKIAEMYRVFDAIDAEISTKESSSKKYISFSIQFLAQSSDQIIYFYKEAGKIEGILSL